MLEISPNGNFGRIGKAVRYNALPIAILAAAIGWFFVSRMERSRGVSKQARTVARGLRQGLDHAGELARGFGGRVMTRAGPDDTVKHHGRQKKVVSDEPMAGYGA
jgi:hypothetical protein